jgi:hypothetical protein
MATNSLTTIPVGDIGPVLGLSSEPKLDFTTREQKRSRDGQPLWTVIAFLVARQASVKVTVPATEQPAITAGVPIAFKSLEAGAYVSGTNAVFYWAADAVGAARG